MFQGMPALSNNSGHQEVIALYMLFYMHDLTSKQRSKFKDVYTFCYKDIKMEVNRLGLYRSGLGPKKNNTFFISSCL